LQSLLIITAAFFIVKSLHFHTSFLCNYTRNYTILEIDNKKNHCSLLA
jgi:hypothetical protein